MVKLRYIKEDQLDLFSWKPKEIEQPREQSTYDGLSDTDQNSWYNTTFFKKRYDEYNKRFFNNQLPSDLPVKKGRVSRGNNIAYCSLTGNKRNKTIYPTQIILSNKDYGNRANLENTLIHEMCHVYQVNELCKNNLDTWESDSKKGSGSSGHGPLFFQAADLVNNSPDNKEGFKITQYDDTHLIKNKPIEKSDGWFVLQPDLSLILVHCISNTPTGRSKIVDYNPIHAFTYKDNLVKTKYVDWFGRNSHLYNYALSKLKEIIADIQNGNLIPVRKPTKHVTELFIGKSPEANLYELVSATSSSIRNKYERVSPVKMNAPYDFLLDMIGDSTCNLWKSPWGSFERVEKAIDIGVYSLKEPLSNFITESIKDKDSQEDIIDDIEEIPNVISVEDITDDTFEIILH